MEAHKWLPTESFYSCIRFFLHQQFQIAIAKDNINFYASLHRFRNTKNQGQPFHKTLNLLSKFPIKAADDAAIATATDAAAAAAAAAATVLTVDTNNVPIFVCTPPRIVRSNPRHVFQETRYYTTVTGGTPCKGKPKNPKNKTAEWDFDQERLKNCRGIPYYTKKRGICSVCGSNFNIVCVGCKRTYCLVNQDSKLTKLVNDKDYRVGFMEGDRHAGELIIKGIADDGTEKEYCIVDNGCYHMQHQKSISESVQNMSQTQLSPVLISP